ncbi:MAG: hypothetical protein JTJ12_18095 [Eubacterium sp.]|nr:hypothetical protein [Eubacterium sp.]
MGREIENTRARLENAGFKLKDENGEDSCLFCNYYHVTDNDKASVCRLLGVQFGNSFEPQNCICEKFDGGIFNSLIDEVKKEAEEKQPKEKEEIKQPKEKEEIKQKDGKVRRILDSIAFRIKNKFE